MTFLLACTSPAMFALDDVALLLKGPIPQRGIVFLSANIIPYEYGEYDFRGHVISVFFTRERDLPVPRTQRTFCDPYLLFETASDEDRILLFSSEDGWHVFIRFPDGFDDICLFSARFLQRFQYFTQISGTPAITQFPAVLDFRD